MCFPQRLMFVAPRSRSHLEVKCKICIHIIMFVTQRSFFWNAITKPPCSLLMLLIVWQTDRCALAHHYCTILRGRRYPLDTIPVLFYFPWTHWAYSGILENRDLLILVLEGICKLLRYHMKLTSDFHSFMYSLFQRATFIDIICKRWFVQP